MGSKGWFIGTVFAGLVSTALSNLSQYYKDMEWVFMLSNVGIVLVALALCGDPGAG
ncbi:hypothetical protein V7195_17245 [Priestia megaterium]|uniref:hypothetical protein n=1 Tax=Priestia megaterium TaxID=1404 RepID=UPI00159665C2|nr:hypothetical protein [Priestia megaterium]